MDLCVGVSELHVCFSVQQFCVMVYVCICVCVIGYNLLCVNVVCDTGLSP